MIKNNIIANNYSAYECGGMKIYHCNARIANNTIINNSSVGFGCGITIICPYTSVLIKNNILRGNINLNQVSGSIFDTHDIYSLSCGSLKVDYNNVELPLSQFIYFGSGNASGDTSHNQTSLNPQLINPTPTASVTYDATIRNFGLSSTSLCINSGDTSGTMMSVLDYNLNPRWMYDNIDRGAIEYNANPQNVTTTDKIKTIVFPNPCDKYVTVQVSESGRHQWMLLNALGQTLLTGTFTGTETTIALNTLPYGLLYVIVDHVVVETIVHRP